MSGMSSFFESAILDPPSSVAPESAKKFHAKMPGFSAWKGTFGQGLMKLIPDKKTDTSAMTY
jgi:hypothetical protein